MNDAILAPLNDEQRLVATSLEAPVAVLAGAGTGKTRALTHRVAYAIAEGKYSAGATLAVTFTTRAAGELRSRLVDLGVPAVQARTIHSAALRQCRYFWPQAYRGEFPEVAERPVAFMAGAVATVLGKRDPTLVRDLMAESSWAKCNNIAPDQYPLLALEADREVAGIPTERVALTLREYERSKNASGRIDFDDILLCCLGVLSEHPKVAEEVYDAYRHFVVDEYQDISAVQHRLLELWVAGRVDVCVVGDPNQAIHGFAGADPKYLEGFAKSHPETKVIRLNRNYRSSPQILEASNRLLKKTAALSAQTSAGPRPIFEACEDEETELIKLIEWLQQCHRDGIPWSELAVLYRINSQSAALETKLAAAGIPYLVRGTERFYERVEVRQLVTSLTTAASQDAQQRPEPLLTEKLADLGWSPQAPNTQGAQRERWESLAALRAMVLQWVNEKPEGNARQLAGWLQERAMLQAPPTAGGLTLSTMHAAKGLEWEAAAVIGVREGLVPFSLAKGEAAVAEEQRVLYVALTRARRQLRISWSPPHQRSRFLARIMGQASATSRSKTTKCQVCARPIKAVAERKLGRHLECGSAPDAELVEKLKQWRTSTAKAASVPAFVVFTDATLLVLAAEAPREVSELLAIPGIGVRKAEQYGAALIELFKEHES